MQHYRRTAVVGALAVLVGGLALPVPAEGQYFGRNQVQYEKFDFEVLQTEHFDVHYYPRERVAAEAAARMAERWYHRPQHRAAPPAHRPTAADPLRHRARVPADQRGRRHRRRHRRCHRSPASPHRAADRRHAQRPRPRARPRAGPRLPVRHDRQRRSQHLRRDAGRDGAPALVHRGHGGVPLARARTRRSRPCGCAGPRKTRFPRTATCWTRATSPIATGRRCWPTSRGRWGDPIMGDLLRAAGRSRNIDLGIQSVLAMRPEQLVSEWHAATYAAYGPAARGDPARRERRRAHHRLRRTTTTSATTSRRPSAPTARS